MSQTQNKRIKIGKQEKLVLRYLSLFPQGVWKDELIRKFSWSSYYDDVMRKRIYNLAKKGLIEIRTEINPETGRSKQRVYLKQ
jgi:hypothetical protein